TGGTASATPPENLAEALFNRLGPTPVDVDLALRTLAQDTGAAPSEAAAALLELELAGRVERRPGAQICRLVERG
ncbi:MAG: hypothetical protein KTR21_14635, partial [Rhodobacteraceae bacterium]|nr:hypothetical protein [Paracoccaceae bacterium]